MALAQVGKKIGGNDNALDAIARAIDFGMLVLRKDGAAFSCPLMEEAISVYLSGRV